ncbi:unnamed protein product [Lepeophtheirus salmonis]|uniref:(salmon louse) hypothetical protein n=1 Tax=Lepeophtheirus salmonis TaxID=72036 RepID=A0A7R8CLS6_LEPSM|nr:unnamed protein product [Lepeophtheirus salmonis]CAF2830651.1 unnamed protein product [Lepeophtheirus salmonis]
MDSSSYERKWIRLREYLPFLRKMIDKLEGRKGSSTELAKVKSLHRVLSSPPSGSVGNDGNDGPFLRMETLLKCEEILKVLYEQVEGPVLESPKSPPQHHSYPLQGNPRVIPLERRSGGLEFTHQKQQQPLTYGEYRRLRQQQHPTGESHYTYNLLSPPPQPEPTPSLFFSLTGSESLQIDEQLPLVKKELKSPSKELEAQEVYSIASPDPQELSDSEMKVEPVEEKEEGKMEVEIETKLKEYKELKPENKPIFFASEDSSTFQPEFTYKEVKFSPTRVNEIKSHSDNIKQVHYKISNLFNIKNKRSSKVRLKVTEVKERSSSLIHPENDYVVVSQNAPQCYSNKISDIINRLKINVIEVAEEENDLQLQDNSSEESLVELLPLIKDLKKDIKDTKFSPLITDKCLKKLKTKDNIDYILPLFKCWISSCNFATDVLDDYRSHLQYEKVTNYHCVYCQKEFEVVDEFLDHVICTHGRCPYQCPYCDFRSTSTLAILIHEQHLHPDQKRCYLLLCKHLCSSEESDTPLKGDVLTCSICNSLSSENISSFMLHMYEKHLNRIGSIQFHCLVCGVSFVKIIELLLHHTFKHGHSPLRVGLLEIEKVSKMEKITSTVVKLKCGYSRCKTTFESLEDFKKHLKECTEGSVNSGAECCYCKFGFESRDALLKHITCHDQFRYSCGLCYTKDLASAHILKHMKIVHGVDKTVCTPCISSKKDKNYQIYEIPRISMFKSPIHCSECDFVSKVRMNFIKHMKLHKKSSQTGVITPINPPPCVDGRHFKNMGAMNEEEDKVLSQNEIIAMPVFIPENQRFKCCSPQCNYITIDEVMLIYHINTLHPKFKESYACPHCSDLQIDYDELGFHLKCHGDLLFKCPNYIRSQVRDVRKDAETRKVMATIKKVEPLKQKQREKSSELDFFPYYCGLCDKSFESLSEVEYHIMHIRGILFEDVKIKKVSSTIEPPPQEDDAPPSPIDDDIPYPYKANCVKCGVIKKSIKNLKTHIQTVHLKSTKFSCNHCSYSSGTLKIIGGLLGKIPKPNQRKKRLGYEAQSQFIEPKKDVDVLKCKHCTYSSTTQKSLKIHNTKCHPNFKFELSIEENEVVDLTGDVEMKKPTVVSVKKSTKSSIPNQNSILSDSVEKQKILKKSKDILSAAQEISPFEHVPTFKCLYCPKRTQSLIRIERHLSTDHPNHTSGHRMLTRDQVVEMITDGPNTQDSQNYSCYFCDQGGKIHELQEHFTKSHSDQTMKVKKKLRNSEENIVAHKYVQKRKNGPQVGGISPGEVNDRKFDINKFVGGTIKCPKINCDFDCKSGPAIMAHLRKHTQTYKCGHCGNTFTQSSAFNNHSAMMHGDKIPDLVKDMEAEAEFEALKGLLEASLINKK